MKRRIIGVVAAVVLAAVGTAVLVAYVRAAERRALAGEITVDVLVVREAIPQGATIADIARKVTAQQVPSKVRAQDALDSLDDLDGKVAAVDLVPGEQLVASRLVQPEAVVAAGEVKVPSGLQQVSVALEPQRAVGGQVKPGDTVGFFASFDPFDIDGAVPGEGSEGEKTPNTTHLTLHKVLVTNVQVEQLPAEQPEAGDTKGKAQPDLAPTGNLLITLAVDAPAAERVVFAAEFGKVWLSAEPEDAPEGGTQIQTRGTIYQ